MLSLVVIARDEADRIGACLASVPSATERIVVDSGSTDGTPEVARRHGARVVVTGWPGYAAQKNRAMELATGDWVLSLDADEQLSPAAHEALVSAIDHPGSAVGFSFACCSHWLGRPIRHGRWYPDRKVRVVRRGRGRWVGAVHERLVVDGPVHPLAADIIHHPYRDLAEHLRTIDRYSALHARALAREGVRARWWDPVVRPPLHFVDAVLLRRGFLDGGAGLGVALLGAAHVFAKWGRLWRATR